MSLFIVIEGLDGSGKTSASRALALALEQRLNTPVKLTFEPHDPSSAGLFIRQILMKKNKNADPNLLALAFATNRLDHCQREITPWLAGADNRIVICDRYYLSSLVYQSTETTPFEQIMSLNQHARRPDVIFFMNVDNKICYERMKIRNQPPELFEVNLSATREKYFKAIEFLKTTHGDTIVEIDGSGTVTEVVNNLMLEIAKIANFDLFLNKNNINETLLSQKIDTEKGTLFLEKIEKIGYEVGKKMLIGQLDCYELEYQMPANVKQRGVAILLNEVQRNDIFNQIIPQLHGMADFILAYSPGEKSVALDYFERSRVQFENDNNEVAVALSPSIQLFMEEDL